MLVNVRFGEPSLLVWLGLALTSAGGRGYISRRGCLRLIYFSTYRNHMSKPRNSTTSYPFWHNCPLIVHRNSQDSVIDHSPLLKPDAAHPTCHTDVLAAFPIPHPCLSYSVDRPPFLFRSGCLSYSAACTLLVKTPRSRKTVCV